MITHCVWLPAYGISSNKEQLRHLFLKRSWSSTTDVFEEFRYLVKCPLIWICLAVSQGSDAGQRCQEYIPGPCVLLAASHLEMQPLEAMALPQLHLLCAAHSHRSLPPLHTQTPASHENRQLGTMRF